MRRPIVFLGLLVIALVVAAAGCLGGENNSVTTPPSPIPHSSQSSVTITSAHTSTVSVEGIPITGPGTYTWKTEIISPPGANTSTFIHVKYNWIVSIVHVTSSTFTYNNTTTTSGVWYWYVDSIISSNGNTIVFVGWIPWNVDQTNFVASTYMAVYSNGTLKAGFFTLIGIGPKK